MGPKYFFKSYGSSQSKAVASVIDVTFIFGTAGSSFVKAMKQQFSANDLRDTSENKKYRVQNYPK